MLRRQAYVRGVSVSLILALAGLAWTVTVWPGSALMPGMTPMPGMPGMPTPGPLPWIAGEPGQGSLSLWLMDGGVFLVSWVLMTMAMMLPTTVAMVDTFSRLTSTRPAAPTHVACFILGYLMAWSGIGFVAYILARGMQMGIDDNMWLMGHVNVLTGSALILAGLYQFTPIKHACLRACRSPLSFFMSHWSAGLTGALRMGARHGAFCIGCCWPLMLLMLAVGMTRLNWMLALALLMFVEKVVRRGEVIGYTAGFLFLLGGFATMLMGDPVPHV